MAVHSIKNQYRGINAHLHSYWQNEGGWDGFHTNHIADLMRLLRLQLLPMGYTAEIEQSLQIRRADESLSRPESDISIFDKLTNRSPRLNPIQSQAAVAIQDLMDLNEELSQYRAVAIYSREESSKPVAWLELLSPSNKPAGQDAAYYRDKRLKVLQAGLVFVELDYLHQSTSTFDYLPSYLKKEASSAHAYRIVVIDPRPALEEGLAYPYEFDVDAPIPVVDIPLNGDDILSFDFQAAYEKTFSETLYGMELVDYSQLPLRFERYSQADQLRILARMLAVLGAVKNGVDIENRSSSLPLPQLAFEEALAQVQNWAT